MRYTPNHKLKAKSKLAVSIAAAVGMAAVFPGTTFAQDEPALEEVVVTGSRIVRRDFEANSPLLTVDSTNLENQAGLNVESYLNQLSNFNPAASPVTSEDDYQPTAVDSVGIASVSLRGFGPNRNLVLLDGHRAVPNNALMVTDVNGIPSAMIERIEIISGGASAVYGADAIGGVTNFILRKDFEGAIFDVQRSETQDGDGEQYRLSAILGTDFADGRGNITVAMEQYDRAVAYERNREFSREGWQDPIQPQTLFFMGYNGFSPDGFQFTNGPNREALRALFPESPSTANQYGASSFNLRLRTTDDGRVFQWQGDNLAHYEALGGVYNDTFAKQLVYDPFAPPGTTPSVIEQLKYNDTKAFESAPQERYSFYTSVNYEITDDLKFYSRLNFNESSTKTQIYSTVPILSWEASAPFNPITDSPVNPMLDPIDPANPPQYRKSTFWQDPANVRAYLANPNDPMWVNPDFQGPYDDATTGHPVSPEVALVLMSRNQADKYYYVEMYPDQAIPRRDTTNSITYWQIENGLEFNLPFKDWTGDAYWSHGESNTTTIAGGQMSHTQWRALVNAPNWGRGLGLNPNAPALEGNSSGSFGNQLSFASWNATNPGFGGSKIECTSGLYPLFFDGGDKDGIISQDCQNLVLAELKANRTNTQDVIELNLQGGIMDLPAGEMRGAVGYSWRDNESTYSPDHLQSQYSWTDQVVGSYPASYLDAATGVKDIYGELLVPVVRDLPFIQMLELELGFRTSTYDYADDTDTWKVLANIEVNDSLRMRGGFNRANRAPNLGELFLGQQEVYLGPSGASLGDACGLRSNASYGAGGTGPDPVLQPGERETELAAGQTTEGARSTRLICEAQMGGAGSPAVEQYYYIANATGATANFGDWWRLQRGNPNLNSEEADTVSFGFVFSNFSDNPWLEGLSGSVDWWKVEIDDAIQQYSPDHAGYLCYGSVIVTNETEALAQANSRACKNVPRNQTNGNASTKLVEYDNQATIKTSGVDVALNWSATLNDIGIPLPGMLNINTQGTILDYYKTKQSPAPYDVEIDWKGSLGPELAGTNPGAYDYRFVTSFTYFLNDLSVNLRWRYLPEVDQALTAQQNAVIANNQRAVAGDPDVIMINYTPNNLIGIADYNIFDLNVGWQINDTLALRAGVNNLLDTQPNYTGRRSPYQVGTDICGANASIGCRNPTGNDMGNTGRGVTSPGYYDVMGRQYFVGLKASF